jgi:hypothetical protein
MVFDWFGPGQRERRRKVRLDRKHLESRSRRFLRSYLMADEERKPAFYRAVEEASERWTAAVHLLTMATSYLGAQEQ